MAIAERELIQPTVLTFEEYLNEGEMPGRYDIIDGIRYPMTSTHDFHQAIVLNVAYAFETYARQTKKVKAFPAQVDIITQKFPLRVRQPDVLLMFNERYGSRKRMDKAPWATAPELAVEVLSETDTKRFIRRKLSEYASVNVLEALLVNPEKHRIEQWQLLTGEESKLLGTYTEGDTITSISFPDLKLDVTEVFEF